MKPHADPRAAAYVEMNRCLACGGGNLETYLDLGVQPLANSCVEVPVEQPAFPLGVRLCRDCWHSQLPVAVDPDLLFKRYLYVSGTTDTLRSYFAWFAGMVEERFARQGPLRVLDIASNDGSLLMQFKAKGHAVQGVDPAENLREASARHGIPTVVDYWSPRVLQQLGAHYDVIVAMNVLAHVADPLGFLELCRRALRPGGRVSGGRIYVQTSQALMLKNGEFDTIYHEHHSFFTVRSMLALAARAGLRVEAVRHVPVHGTSYLFELTAAEGGEDCAPGDFEIERQEAAWGYYERPSYAAFGQRALRTRDRVRELVGWHRGAGYAVVGYGVAAKGMTFVNFAGLDFDYLIDDNPLKVGLLTPGRNNPIHGPDRLESEERPGLFVVLAWNFYDEVLRRIAQRRTNPRDGFLAYFPQVKLINPA
jgi:SAM-dependent methyltransferase